MKKLIALLLAVGVSLVSCSDNATLDVDDLGGLKKRFDFSNVNTEELHIYEIHEFKGNNSDISPDTHLFEEVYLDLAAVIGEIDDCLWLGLFDRESGELKYQYTDFDHPISYYAYGIEYKYEIGTILGIHFEDHNGGAIAIQYTTNPQQKNRLDLIIFNKNQETNRTIISDNIRAAGDNAGISAMRWSANTICLGYLPTPIGIIYDISKREILCHIIDNINNGEFFAEEFFRFVSNKDFVSPLNPLHFWSLSKMYVDIPLLRSLDIFSNKIKITELQCSYDTVTKTEKDIELFEAYTGDSSKAPRYSVEYKTRTDDRISAVVTQTAYDGTITTKTVDIRVENDELNVEIE